MDREQLHPWVRTRSKRFLRFMAWTMFIALSPIVVGIILYEGLMEYWDEQQAELYDIDQLEDM